MLPFPGIEFKKTVKSIQKNLRFQCIHPTLWIKFTGYYYELALVLTHLLIDIVVVLKLVRYAVNGKQLVQEARLFRYSGHFSRPIYCKVLLIRSQLYCQQFNVKR